MKETILRFRMISSHLIDGKTKTKGEIQRIMNISEPTLKRLMTETIDESFHIRASILGAIQDFNKRFCDYERIDIEPATDVTSKIIELAERAGKERKAVTAVDNLKMLTDLLT